MEGVILELIHSAIRIEPIADNTSLYSFVFKITNADGRLYLLKISLVYEDGERPTLERYNGILKAPVKKSDFINEAETQKMIHTTNFNICPDVIAYGFFELNNILDIIIKINKSEMIMREITYLQQYLDSNFEVGIMVQEFARGVPISDCPTKEQIIRVGALLLLLFIDCRVIHIDLHLNNVLCSDLRCTLIDFGNIVSFQEGFEHNMELFEIPYIFKDTWIRRYIDGYIVDGVYDINKKFNEILLLDDKRKIVQEVLTLIYFVNLLIVNKNEYKKREKLIIKLPPELQVKQTELNSKQTEFNSKLDELNFKLDESNKTLKSKEIELSSERNKYTKKNLKNEIEQIENQIDKIEEDIEEIEKKINQIEEIEYHEFRCTQSRMIFSRFDDMYKILNENKSWFPEIYDAFLANRQNVNAYGYKKEKRKKTVTKKRNNKNKYKKTKINTKK